MKRYLKYKKGNVLLIIPIFLVGISLITMVIYKIISINSTKTYIYPYKYNSSESFEENDFDLVNNYIKKIDTTQITNTEELRNYLKSNNLTETLGSSSIYYDVYYDCIYIERRINEGTIKNRLSYNFQDGKVILSLTKYYEGV